MTLAPAPIPSIPNDLLKRSLALIDQNRPDRYVVSVDEYVAFRRDGVLIVRGLVSKAEIDELRQHTEDLMQGRLPEQQQTMQFEYDADGKPIVKNGVHCQGLEKPPEHFTPEQKADFWLRIHMLHRKLEIHERFLLHPRVIDVLEALIGPDILALQSMLFLKGPGKPGQGFHQDSYYIPTYPDSLCGAWIAVDDVDEENGCMYFTPGSQHEPIYPPADSYGFGDAALAGMQRVRGVSDTDDTKNDLARIAAKKYGVTSRGVNEICARMKAGDVAFFGGHVFHRSHTNVSKDRFRRSFVGHYCNARCYTDWGADGDLANNVHASPAWDRETGMSNASHILARGDTHLPFAKPRFGTPCSALIPTETRRQFRRPGVSMMGMPSGQMGQSPHGSDDDHDKAHAAEEKAAQGYKAE